jgi:hypothetical protein
VGLPPAQQEEQQRQIIHLSRGWRALSPGRCKSDPDLAAAPASVGLGPTSVRAALRRWGCSDLVHLSVSLALPAAAAAVSMPDARLDALCTQTRASTHAAACAAAATAAAAASGAGTSHAACGRLLSDRAVLLALRVAYAEENEGSGEKAEKRAARWLLAVPALTMVLSDTALQCLCQWEGLAACLEVCINLCALSSFLFFFSSPRSIAFSLPLSLIFLLMAQMNK